MASKKAVNLQSQILTPFRYPIKQMTPTDCKGQSLHMPLFKDAQFRLHTQCKIR